MTFGVFAKELSFKVFHIATLNCFSTTSMKTVHAIIQIWNCLIRHIKEQIMKSHLSDFLAHFLF